MRFALLLICASVCWGQAKQGEATAVSAALEDPGKEKATKAEKDVARLAAWKRPTAKVKGKDEPDPVKIAELRESRIKSESAGYDKIKSKKLAFAPTKWTLAADYPSTVIVFPSRAVADAVMNEIAVMPQIEGGSGPVWLWFDPYQPTNLVGMNCEPSGGRCAIAHWWALDSVDVAWIQAYVAASWPTITFSSALPVNWVQAGIL